MSWISEYRLVSSISKSGGFGVIACSSMSVEQLENEIELTKKSIDEKPFGVNIILMHPDLDRLIDVCIKNKVSHIILAGGIPTKSTIEKIKSSNAKAIAFAPSVSVAKRMLKIGIDALIIEGMEAGGHIGRVSTSVLAQEILPEIVEVPVFVAGGIGTGKIVVNYLNMGASGCQIGTLFACAKESIAHPEFKKKFINASSYDTVISAQLDSNFPVIPVRSIKNNATKEFIDFQKSTIEKYSKGEISKEEGQLAIEKFWAGSLRRAVIDGDVERGSLMAGEIVGLVKEELPVQQIIDNIITDAEIYTKKG